MAEIILKIFEKPLDICTHCVYYRVINERATAQEGLDMTAIEIMSYAEINSIEAARTLELKKSIMDNGWIGAPILVSTSRGMLITGSHRLAALKSICDSNWSFDLDALGDVAEDVDDIINAWCEENDCTIDDLPYDCLSLVFAGTWVEDYKDDIVEW